MATLSLWSELVPYDELMRPALLGALERRSLGLFVAVTPDDLPGLPEVCRACRRRGVRLGVWPMLRHEDGRWPSADNVETFARFTRDLLEALDHAAALPDALVVDLEPPIGDMPGLLATEPRAIARQVRRGLRRSTIRRYTEVVEGIERRGIETICASFPLVVSDAPGIGGWQRFLGTPVDGAPFSRVSPMVYTSMIEGYARGRLHRTDVVALLGAVARASRHRYGSRASLSLGAVGQGILGDEPVYRDPTELAEDVGVARAAGIDHLVLFSLGGVLSRAPVAPWLDALAAPPAARLPRLTPRAAATIATCKLLSRAIDGGQRAARLLLGRGPG